MIHPELSARCQRDFSPAGNNFAPSSCQDAYENRVNLLDRLNEWYANEIDEIDEAIERIEGKRYNFSAVPEAIEDAGLETAPEAEFCSACQSYVFT